MSAAIALPLVDTDLYETYLAYVNAVSSSFEDAVLRAKMLLRSTKRSRKTVPTTVGVFPRGLLRRVANCPRCGQLLQQEPGGMYCRWGCTRRFVLEGTPVENQFEWERHSGLIGPESDNTAQIRNWTELP